MPVRRRVVVVAGFLGLAGVVAVVAWMVATGWRPGARVREAIDLRSPLAAIAAHLRQGDAQALAILVQRVTPRPDQPPSALKDEEVLPWLNVLNALRDGYLRFSPYGRASALEAGCRILDKFAVEPAPRTWDKALRPMHDLLTAGLADSALNVRMTALEQMRRLWDWVPGCTPDPAQENDLAGWKQALHLPVVRRLADPEPTLRAAAVACLAALPIDRLAAPGAAYHEDPSAIVRAQVLSTYAQRRNLLSDEAVLARISDRDPRIPIIARQVLKARGLTQDQIDLGALIMHPKPELRASVIPLLTQRSDIDPVVWLLQLSRDPVESVRLKAIPALAEQPSSAAKLRLEEMAVQDSSPTVRKAASQAAFQGDETAALPPLPGSPSLTPKAN
jgi:hypothetical protein